MSKSKTAIEQTQARWRRSQSVRKKSLDNENRFIDVASSIIRQSRLLVDRSKDYAYSVVDESRQAPIDDS